ncbi:MAG: hypothetical protein AB7I42_29045 [Bradyrhizobium sp.]|uniref:hypothetical protein n=1 Tax=Bradyrhizobium sp. TaxID=376 RepID=UPI003D130C39
MRINRSDVRKMLAEGAALASKREGVRVLVRPADLNGEALAAWRAQYLDVPTNAELTVIIHRFTE